MALPSSLQDITVLYETSRIEEAAKYVSIGWRLLKIAAKRDAGEYVAYVLGWPSTAPPRYPCANHYFRGGSKDNCSCKNSTCPNRASIANAVIRPRLPRRGAT